MPSELVILVGLPGAGKSTFCTERFAATHVVVSKDRMKSARSKTRRQAREIDEALALGKPVVVDNTNASAEERRAALEIGVRHGARAIAYWFDESVAACRDRNAKREGDARVPDVGLYATAARFTRPLASEGFAEIHRVRLQMGQGFVVEPEAPPTADPPR